MRVVPGPVVRPMAVDSVALNRPPRGVMLDVYAGASVMADRGELYLPRIRALGRNPTPALGTPEFEKLLDVETQSIARAGNRVTLLENGKRAYDARDALFASAKPGEVIHQQTFVSSSDATGWRNAKQMIRHARIGPARHVFDPIGSFRAVRKRRLFDFMRKGRVEVAQLNDTLGSYLMSVNRLNHQKMLLLGNRKAIVGGINIGDMYANSGVPGNGVEGVREGGEKPRFKIIGWEKPYRLIDFRGWLRRTKITTYKQPWHDMDFLVEGPVVADLQRAFIRTWLQSGRTMDPAVIADLTTPVPAYDDGVSVRFIDHRPIQDRDDYITAAIVRHIEAANDSIVIENPYFSPPRVIRDALCAAARKGVRVSVLTNSREAINHKIAYDAGHGMYRELLAAGVRILEKSPMVHGKFIVVDDKVTLGGSANLNGRTRHKDAETLIVVNSEALAKQTRAVIEAQYERCVEAKPDAGIVQSARDLWASLIRKSA